MYIAHTERTKKFNNHQKNVYFCISRLLSKTPLDYYLLDRNILCYDVTLKGNTVYIVLILYSHFDIL